jgi:hypothetical protein
MSTYASAQDVANYIEGWVTDDVFALERLIQRCEQDIDLLVVRTHAELPPTQVISLPGATGGNFTLGFNGVNTASLPYNATAAQIETALQAIAAIGSDENGVSNAQVLGSNPWTVVWTVDWVRSNYVGNLAPINGVYPVSYQVPLLTVNTSALQPSNVAATVVQIQGRKINPLVDIDINQRLALSRATCAQIEYRNAMGERFFIRPQYDTVRGPDFTTVGRLPMIAPKARRELSQNGLIHTAGRAYTGWGRRGIARGWPTY